MASHGTRKTHHSYAVCSVYIKSSKLFMPVGNSFMAWKRAGGERKKNTTKFKAIISSGGKVPQDQLRTVEQI